MIFIVNLIIGDMKNTVHYALHKVQWILLMTYKYSINNNKNQVIKLLQN